MAASRRRARGLRQDARLRRHPHLRPPRLAQAVAGVPHHARAVGEGIGPTLSWPGLTRPSILLRKKMDARVKPAHDDVATTEFHIMGGTTQTVDKNQADTTLVTPGGTRRGPPAGTNSASGTTNPWAPAQPFLSGILAQLQGQLANASLTPQENATIGALANSSGYISQFLPQAT